MTRGNFAKISQEICKFCIIVCTAPPHEFHTPKKKLVTTPRRGWICGDVNSWLTASTWSSQAWLTFVLFFISLCLLRAFVAWWPETPPPLRTPQSPADGRPGSRSLSRAVTSSMKLYRTCHLCVVIILFAVPHASRSSYIV